MDRLKQKALNCLTTAREQAHAASDLLYADDPIQAEGLLKSALVNLERARHFFNGTIDNQFVNELAREIDAEGGPTRPATWGDVVHFVLGISRPRLRRAWNLAMVVLTEET